MAIITDESTCAICDQPLSRPYIDTWGTFFEPNDPLFRYCDAPLHIDCVADWPHRVEFSNGYFAMWRENYRDGGGNLLVEREDWMLVTGPVGPHIKPDMKPAFVKIMLEMSGRTEDTLDPIYAEVITANWPLRLRSDWLQWDQFISGLDDVTPEDAANVEAKRVLLEVREIAPNLEVLRKLLINHQRNTA